MINYDILVSDLRAISDASHKAAATLEATLSYLKNEQSKIASKLAGLDAREHSVMAREQAQATAQSQHASAVAEYEAARTAFEAQRQDYSKIKAEAEQKLADVLEAENFISRLRDDQKRQKAEIEKLLAELDDKSKAHDNREKELVSFREQLDQDDARVKQLAKKAGVSF